VRIQPVETLENLPRQPSDLALIEPLELPLQSQANRLPLQIRQRFSVPGGFFHFDQKDVPEPGYHGDVRNAVFSGRGR
jgi:cell division FtsZ-interacting protein ZapD